MNVENIKQAIRWLEELPDNEFDMKEYYGFGEADLTGWGVDPEWDIPQHLFEREGDMPCGTVCCLAGLIHFNVCETVEQRRRAPIYTASKFLGVSSTIGHSLFCSARTYGRACLTEVTKQDVITKLSEMIEAES